MRWPHKRSLGRSSVCSRTFPVHQSVLPGNDDLPPEARGKSPKSKRARAKVGKARKAKQRTLKAVVSPESAPSARSGRTTPNPTGVKIFILSHVPERFESVPDWPEFERVLLPALPLDDDLRTDLIGEGRAFLADLDSGGAEYVGYINARAPAKYGGATANASTYWDDFRARLASLTPNVVLTPNVAESWWAEFSAQEHPGMLPLLHELRDLTGLRLDTGRSSLWANDMVMHHSVWTEWLAFWRRCFAHFHGRWGWDWPFPPLRLDSRRKPAYFAERWTTLFFANRADLTIVRT